TPNADGVYEIETEAELKEFRDGINDGTIPIESNAKLMADITLTENWTPIGYREVLGGAVATDYRYNGVFDGNGRTISGLKVTPNEVLDWSATATLAGFFGGTNTEAVLKNFVLSNVDVVGDATSRTAAVSGVNYGLIENVGVEGISRIYGQMAGGITGSNNTDGKINSVYVKQDMMSGVIHGEYVGGIAGANDAYSAGIFYSFVHNIQTISGDMASGGVVGANNYVLSHCYAENIEEILGGNAGGIIGRNWNSLTSGAVVLNSYAKDIKTITAAGTNGAGGIVGHSYGKAEVINSYAENIGSISAATNAGGIGGMLQRTGKLQNCLLLGSPSIETTLSAGSQNREGGVLGYLTGAENNLDLLVNCFYPSNITFTKGEDKPIGNVPLVSMDAQYNIGSYDVALSEEELPAIIVLLDNYTLTLAVGESRTFDASTLPGKAGDYICVWGTDDASIVSAAGDGLTVTVTGVAVGSSTVTAKIRGDINVDLSCAVNVVEETDEADPTVTGTPADGTIYPGEDVELVYDFSPCIAIAVDNSGMQTPISGLLADILDGKVVVMGVSKEAGTYFYVVTLQRPDGSTFTQKVYVTIQGGSRPTGDTKSGGGSSNCNSGVGAALFALLGLAFIQKRK
ncbi:Ig-like domain-containing protein, partial [Synergistaceae bacterium OttesenSCG-928-D05]|nr:Ig-like domain-containing protein [Synergistaceae bacterium OttesenSCG-928-D05]